MKTLKKLIPVRKQHLKMHEVLKIKGGIIPENNSPLPLKLYYEKTNNIKNQLILILVLKKHLISNQNGGYQS